MPLVPVAPVRSLLSRAAYLYTPALARLLRLLTAALATLALAGCAHFSQRQQNAAVGAGVGAVAGSVLTGGSTLGTLGGAAIGGLIGNGSVGRPVDEGGSEPWGQRKKRGR